MRSGPGQDHAKNGWFVVTLAMLAALSATTVDICIPAQPTIAAAFGARSEAGGVIVSAYLLGYGPGQVAWGPLSDHFGRNGPLAVGLSLFGLLSLACPFADSLATLAALRTAQGVFAGSGPVIARAVARDQGGGARTARLLATIAMIFGGAPMLAPVLGSAILAVADWRAQFWFLALLSAMLLIGARRFVRPATRAPVGGARPLFSHGRAALTLLFDRDFLAPCGALAAAFGGYAALLSTGAAMTQAHYGIAPQAFGPLFATAAGAVIVGSALSRRSLRSRPPLFGLRIGALLVTASAGGMLFLSTSVAPLWLLWTVVSTYVLGFGMMLPLANAIALEPAGESAGIASSLLGAVPTLTGAGGATLASAQLFDSPYRAVCTTMGGAGLACLIAALLVRRRA